MFRLRIVIVVLAALGVVYPASAQFCTSATNTFVCDNFTGTNGTTLQAHAPNTGLAWTRVIGSNLNIQTNALRATAINAGDFYSNAAPATSANYVVGMTVTFGGNSANNYIDVFGRANVTLQSGYLAQVQANGAVIVWAVTGGALGTPIINTTTTITLNVAHQVILRMVGNQISVFVDATQFGPVTNNTIAAAGVAGLGLNANNITQVIADNFFAGTFAVTEAPMSGMAASRDRGRTLVEWETGRESENLGFNIWREDREGPTRVNRSLIAGSALLTTATLTAGNRYRWIDEDGTPRSRYWIESVSLDGRREWHGPIVPSKKPFDASRPSAPLLRDAGQRVVPAERGSRLAVGPEGTHRAVAPPALLPRQQALAAGAAIKISVDADGWIRITHDQLLAAGLDPATDPHRLHLFAEAQEVAITVEGEIENRIDAIRFYGTAIDTPSSSTHVYWLASADGPARRIAIAGATDGASSPGSFPVTVERRDKSIFFTALLNGDEESFFGPLVSGDPSAPTLQSLRLTHVDRSAPSAGVEIALQGVANVGDDQPHDVAVALNGHALDDIVFSGRDATTVRREVPTSWLLDDDNSFTLTAKNGDADVSLVSHVRITYAHTYDLDDGRLTLTTAGGTAVAVGGASSSDVRVLDVTAPGTPIALTPTIESGTARFTAPGSGTRTVVVLDGPMFATASRVEANRPSSLHTASADMVIITHPSLLAAVEPLRALRASQGLSVLVATVDDIYDEFSYGTKDPPAIHKFLDALRPRYALLVGDASFDPRDYLGFGDNDLVPTKLINTREIKTASDSWFADFDGDGASDFGIGRLPVRTMAEAQTEIGKIIAYEGGMGGASWEKSVVLLNDDDSALGFDQMSADVRELVPAGYDVESIDTTASGAAAARTSLLSNLESGALLVNFIGHGSVEIWASGGALFANADANTLHNGDRLPFVVAMTCLNGYFHDLYTTSLAEVLLAAPNGGAVGVFASSSVTDAGAQMAADQALVSALLAHTTLGDAAAAAQKAATDSDVRRTFLLFGDPSMRLR
jgi:hypothetical protein